MDGWHVPLAEDFPGQQITEAAHILRLVLSSNHYETATVGSLLALFHLQRPNACTTPIINGDTDVKDLSPLPSNHARTCRKMIWP